MWFQRRRYASTAQRPSSLSEHVNTRYGRQNKRAVSWKRGVVAEPFHARLIKPITPSLSDPRDVSRPTHHVSLFSFSSCLYVYTKIFYQLILQRTIPPSYFFQALFFLSSVPSSPSSSSYVLWLCAAASLVFAQLVLSLSPPPVSPLSLSLSSATSLAADRQIILRLAAR